MKNIFIASLMAVSVVSAAYAADEAKTETPAAVEAVAQTPSAPDAVQQAADQAAEGAKTDAAPESK